MKTQSNEGREAGEQGRGKGGTKGRREWGLGRKDGGKEGWNEGRKDGRRVGMKQGRQGAREASE